MSHKRLLTVPQQDDIVSVDTPNRDEFFKNALSDKSKGNVLGRGSYGTVVKAVYKKKQVAVKIIDNQNITKLCTLNNESNILEWQHENIIKILKIVSTSIYSLIIMERFPGQCLQYVLDSIVIPVIHRIFISIDICNALIYCHDKGLIHLDVKPQNILVAYLDTYNSKIIIDNNNYLLRSYICKLCDFGSSLNIEKGFQQNDTLNRGTIRYMSPEVLKRSNITISSDIYSFGITMWQLKTRIYPYSTIESNDIVAYRVVKENLRPDNINLININNILYENNLNLLHTNCICEHYSSDLLSNYSIENLQKILKISKSLDTSLSFINNLSQLNDKKRIPFMNLNNKLNIQSCNNNNNNNRFLSQKFDKNLQQQQQQQQNKNNNNQFNQKLSLKNSKISIKITTENGNENLFKNNNDENILHASFEKNFDLKNIFKNSQLNNENLKNVKFNEKIENDIEILYRNCWNEDYIKRPNAIEIKNILQNILMKISSKN